MTKTSLTSFVVPLVAALVAHSSFAGAQSRTVGPPGVARVTPPTAPPPSPSEAASAPAASSTPPLPGEQEALLECHKYPIDKRFKWELRGEVDLTTLLNAVAPMVCRPIVVSANIRQSKVTVLVPSTVTAPEAYRLFLSALETMGLTIQPEGKVLKVIESARARESAIPLYGEDSNPPSQDQFVTRLLRLEHVSPDEVKGVLDRLKSRDGDITSYAPTNTLVITDLGTNIRRMEKVVRQLDVAMGGEKIWVIKLHQVAAADMAQMLSTIFNVKAGAPQGKRPNLTAPVVPPPGAPPGAPPGTSSKQPGPPGSDLSVSQIIPDDRQNLLVIVSTESAYRRILSLVKRLDQENLHPGDQTTDLVHVLPLENANADDVATTLGGLGASVSKGGAAPAARPATQPGQQKGASLFEGDVRISSDKPTNSLVILATGRDYMTVRELIRKLDQTRRQVFVEAAILEISIDKTRKLGIAFHGGAPATVKSANDSLFFTGAEYGSDLNSLVFSPAALQGLAAGFRGPELQNAATALGLPVGTSVPSFGVFLQALQTNGDVNVVSMPNLLTTDNEKATISVGQNLPFPGTISGFPGLAGAGGAAGSFGFGTFGSVQRQDVALKLDITPHVNASDNVRLEIDNELSDVANPNFNGLGPSTSKRTVKSVVTIRDQQSVVLGGLMKDRVSETVTKIPLLGDIPILGYLFKRTERQVTKQNLLIVLTPYVIKEASDLRRIFERKLRERREFMERYSAFKDARDYEPRVDYRRKRGLLEEINQTAVEAEEQARELRTAEAAMGRDISGPVDIDPSPAPRSAVDPALQPSPLPRAFDDGAAVVTEKKPKKKKRAEPKPDAASTPAPSPTPAGAVNKGP